MAEPKRYAVLDPVRVMQPGVGPPTAVAYKTVRWKPRKVVDVRWKGLCSHEALIAAIRSFEMRRAAVPDVIRVAPEMKEALKKEAQDWTNKVANTFAVPASQVGPPRKGLTFYGVKVTL